MKRPIIVSVVSFLAAVSLLFVLKPLTLALIFGVTIFPLWYEILFLILILVKLYSLVEVWKMKKRGLELFTLLSIIAWVTDLSMGYALGTGFIIDLLFVILLWTQYKKMEQPSLLKRG